MKYKVVLYLDFDPEVGSDWAEHLIRTNLNELFEGVSTDNEHSALRRGEFRIERIDELN